MNGIYIATEKTTEDVYRMWKICFEDSDEFMQFYFKHKYKAENTLIYFDNNKAVASLQMLPYNITFYGKEVPTAYISGACTLPECRKKGYMEKLLVRSFEVMRERNVPISTLIPAEEWLYGFYGKYDYAKTFEADSEEIQFREIIKQHQKIEDAYTAFDSLYRKKNLCMQKTFADFLAIVEDAKMENFPSVTNLSGMARIIMPKELLNIYTDFYSDKEFNLEITDPIIKENNIAYSNQPSQTKHKVSIKDLASLLFGKQIEDESLSAIFERQDSTMNLMLE